MERLEEIKAKSKHYADNVLTIPVKGDVWILFCLIDCGSSHEYFPFGMMTSLPKHVFRSSNVIAFNMATKKLVKPNLDPRSTRGWVDAYPTKTV